MVKKGVRKEEPYFKGPQTYQIGNELISKEDYEREKSKMGLTTPIQPFSDDELITKQRAEQGQAGTSVSDVGRTSQQFQIQQQKIKEGEAIKEQTSSEIAETSKLISTEPILSEE